VTLFAGVAYPAFAQASTDLDTLYFKRDDFKRMVSKNPQLSLNMIAIMSHHLRRFATLVEDLSLKDVPARLAGHLLSLAERSGRETTNGLEVELDTTKTELAQKLGTISETISRTLNKLRSTGVVETCGKKVTILDIDMLEEIASGLKR